MTIRKYEFTRSEAAMLHKLVASECSTFKNHIASAVERGDFDGAKLLVVSLREMQKLFAATNVAAHEIIDKE